VLAVAGAAQFVLAWLWPPTSPGFEQWLATVWPGECLIRRGPQPVEAGTSRNAAVS
jgi:hypothetical protein